MPAVACLFAATASAQQQLQTQPLMGQPLLGLSPVEQSLFEEGLEAFSRPLTASEGAGPIFNELTCAACHNVPAVGGFGTRVVTRFGVAATATMPFQSLDQLGGSLLQDQSFDVMCQETVPAIANVTASRATPICFGLGLIESIPDSVLIDRANNQPSTLAGRLHIVQPLEDPNGPMRVGRMGWKGGIATVDSFSIDAGLGELGLTSQFAPFDNAPNGDMALLAQCDIAADPEDAPDAAGFTLTDRFTHFQRFLAAPAQTPQTGMSGELVFEAIGCADCHVPSYTTGTVAEPALSNKVIRPYSDFLLHDVGALGDQIVDGTVTETEMQTRSLWGLVQRTSYLHDGRATGGEFAGNVETAIAEHLGTAQPSADAYFQLPQADKDLMLSFLASLGRAEFDIETDNFINEFDWFFLQPLLTGPEPATPLTPDDLGAIGDVDVDGDFDLVEFGSLQRVWTGQ